MTKPFGESTASKVLNLVEHAAENKSRNEFHHQVCTHLYPVVVALAVIVAVVPPFVSGDFVGNFSTWFYRALMFLVVSCPCALVISVPSHSSAASAVRRAKGILVKGSNYMETLAHTKVIAFDKTGTMTKGVFEVAAVHPSEISPNQLLHLCRPCGAFLHASHRRFAETCLTRTRPTTVAWRMCMRWRAGHQCPHQRPNGERGQCKTDGFRGCRVGTTVTGWAPSCMWLSTAFMPDIS